jgi:hypothetical protein
MTSEAVAGDRSDSFEAITTDRYELTYAVPSALYRELAGYFDGQLASAAEYLVTTAYFDTPARRLLAAARSHARDNTKLRAKEYFDLRPTLSTPDASSAVWLEPKRRSGSRTQKHRVRLSRSALERWVCERSAPPSNELAGRESDAQVLEAYFAAEPELLEPASLVNYRRRSWQSQDGQLRITLDANLAFFAASAELLRSRSPLREQLGHACETEPGALLEVKHRARSVPAWLGAGLERFGLRSSVFSKFVASALAVERLKDTF